MVLLLSRKEVSDLFDMGRAIELTEKVFVEQAEGRVYPWAPFVVGHDDHELRVNAGSLAGVHRAGLRFSMRGGGVVALYDTATEQFACLMAYPWTYLRVGATVAVAVDRLASPSAARLMIVGTGRIARASLHGISCRRKFARVQVYSPQAIHRETFCSNAKSEFGIHVESVEDVERAVRDADVIVVATSADGPALRFSWVAPGTHVSTAGIRCEVEEELYLKADRVVVGSIVQERDYRGWIDETNDNTLVRLTREGRLPWERIVELGEVVSGRCPRPQGITVFRESQGGFGDLMFAHWVYERAKELGRGQAWDCNAQ